MMGINFYHLFFRLWPDKTILLKSFVPDTETVAFPEKYLDDISALIAKCEKVASKNIAVKIIRHKLAESINRFAHISMPNSYIDLTLLGNHHD